MYHTSLINGMPHPADLHEQALKDIAKSRSTRQEKRKPEESNRAYVNQKHFQDACDAAGIPPTTRQASKFRNKRGAAYEAHKILTR